MQLHHDGNTEIAETFSIYFCQQAAEPVADIIENLYRANDTYAVKGNQAQIQKRQDYQQEAMELVAIWMRIYLN